jgi:uncharacterized protein YaiE (UPF0345 family)
MANVKVTALTALTAADSAATDVLPIVDVSADATKKLAISDLHRSVPDGTLSAPGIAFQSDLNSGLYRSGTDAIALVTNGAARILIDATGNVTIPNDLTVQGATTFITGQTVLIEDKNIELGVVSTPTDVTANGGGITLKGTTDKTIQWIDSTNAWTFNNKISVQTSVSGSVYAELTTTGSALGLSANLTAGSSASDSVALNFKTSNSGSETTKMRINPDGKVGIGTEEPTLTDGNGVHIAGSSGALKLQNTTNGNWAYVEYADESNTTKYIQGYRDSTGLYAIRPGTTLSAGTGISLDSSGNVGIGKASSGNKLEIEGQGNTKVVIDGRTDAANGSLATLELWSKNSSGTNNFGFIEYDGDGSFEIGSGGGGAGSVPLVFKTNANERMRIDSSGNVKIVSEHLRFNTSGKGIIFGTEGGSDRPSILGNYTSAGDNNIVFNVTGSERMRIDSSGNIGIGQSSPAQLLHLTSTGSNAFVQFSDSGSGGSAAQVRIGSNGNDLVILNNTSSNAATERMRIASSGNVGVGTGSPDELLHVNGNIKYGPTGFIADGDLGFIYTGTNNNTYGQVIGTKPGTTYSTARNFTVSLNPSLSAGREVFRIQGQSGNVGIGTTSPTSLGSGFKEVIVSGATEGAGLQLQDTDGNVKAGLFTSDVSGAAFIRTITNHPLAFRTNNSERMRIDSSGHILVKDGTAGTYADFVTYTRGEDFTTAPKKIVFPNQYSTGNDDTRLKIYLFNSGLTRQGFGTGSSYDLTYHSSGGVNQAKHIFFIDGSEKLRIDPYGRLLVGTGTYTGNGQVAIAGNSSGSSAAGCLDIRPTLSRPTAANTTLSLIRFGAADHSNNTGYASINVSSDGASSSDSDLPGRLEFHTTADGASSPTERMRIDSSGNVKLTGGSALFWDDAGDRYISCHGDTSSNLNLHGRNSVIFETNGSTFNGGSERMRIDSSGRVGIGTTSPSELLHCEGSAGVIKASSSSDSKFAALYAGNSSHDSAVLWQNGALRFYNTIERMRIDSSGNVGIGTTSVFDTASGRGNISLNGASSALIALGVGGSQKLALFHSGTDCELNNQANGFLAFKTNNSERMRIDSSGRLLVGGTSTAENDHANINANGTLTIRRASSGDDCIVIKEGSTNSLLIEASGNVFNYNVGSFAYTSYDNEAGVAGPYAALGSFSGEARISAGSTGSDDVPLVFRTSDGGTLAEKMKLTHDGLLIINNLYNTTSSGAANVFVGSNSQLFRSTSSIKYKENVQDATHGLAKLLELRPVTYTSKQPDNDSTVYGGLIAEEVHEAGLSEFVQYATDGSPDALAYGNMVSLCVKAIQEQQSIIKSLETRIAALES